MQRCRYCSARYASLEERLRCESVHLLQRSQSVTSHAAPPPKAPRSAPRANEATKSAAQRPAPVVGDEDSGEADPIAPALGYTQRREEHGEPSPRTRRVTQGGGGEVKDEEREERRRRRRDEGAQQSSSSESVDYNRLDGGDGSDEDVLADHDDESDVQRHARLAAKRDILLRSLLLAPRSVSSQDVLRERSRRAANATSALSGDMRSLIKSYCAV